MDYKLYLGGERETKITEDQTFLEPFISEAINSNPDC